MSLSIFIKILSCIFAIMPLAAQACVTADDLEGGIRVAREGWAETYQKSGDQIVSTSPFSSSNESITEIRYDVVPFVTAYRNIENGVVYAPSIETVDYSRSPLPNVTADWTASLEVTYTSDGERLTVTNEYQVKRSLEFTLSNCSYHVLELYIIRGGENSWDQDAELIWYFPELQIAPLVDSGEAYEALTAKPPIAISVIE